MARKEFSHLKPKKVAEALTKAKGIITLAAQMLDCSTTAIYKQIEKHQIVSDAKDKAEEGILDTAESKLFEALDKGERWAIQFILSSKGRKRGYVIQKDLESPAEVPTSFTLTLGEANKPIQSETRTS